MLIGIGLRLIISLTIGLLRLIVLVINEMHPMTIRIQEITVIDLGRLFTVLASFLPNAAVHRQWTLSGQHPRAAACYEPFPAISDLLALRSFRVIMIRTISTNIIICEGHKFVHQTGRP
jgi:hypothetical protein